MKSRLSVVIFMGVVFMSVMSVFHLGVAAAHSRTCEALFEAIENPIDQTTLDNFLIRPQPIPALIRVAANRAHGMTWKSAIERKWTSHPTFGSATRLFKAHEDPILRYAATTEGLNHSFPARFTVFPITYFSRDLTTELGIPREAYLFNMSLADREVRDEFQGSLEQFPFLHLQDSFGYIRFYVRGSDLVVTEIQSEIYRHLTDPRLKSKYKMWSRQLLLAFADYAATTFFPSHPNGSILIAGADYQLRRWRTTSGAQTLSSDLVRVLYRDLPKKLGYTERAIDFAIEWPGHLCEEENVEQPEPIRQGYGLSARDVANGKFAGELKLDRTPEGAVHETSLAFETLLRRQIEAGQQRQLASRWAPISYIGNYAAQVRYTVLPKQVLYAGSDKLQAAHQRLLQSVPLWMRLTGNHTLIALGRAGLYDAIDEPVDFAARKLHFLHWQGADRHPVVFEKPTEVFAIKGGGRRTLETKPGSDQKLRRQVFALKETITESHAVWGGLLESHGRTEFINHLRLFQLGHLVGFRPSVGMPIDVGWMEEAPRVTAKGYELVPMQSYLSRELSQAPERLVQFRSYTRSPYRVYAFTQILNSPDGDTALRELLQSLYAAYGAKLKWIEPERSLKNSNQTPNQAEAYGFLHALAQHNGATPQRIVDEFARRTLMTIGFVHGLDGHLGGTAEAFFEGETPNSIIMSDKLIGAPTGGATQTRNVTFAGELRDLDGNVHLPNTPLSMWPSYPDILKYNLLYFQKQDLRHWQDTFYQFRTAVLGLEGVPPGTEIPPYIWGDPASSGGLRTIPYGHSPESQAIYDYLQLNYAANTVIDIKAQNLETVILDPKLRALYLEGVKLGRAARAKDDLTSQPR